MSLASRSLIAGSTFTTRVSTPSKILSYIYVPFSAVARFMGVIATS
jgi:hypothetical protein